MLIWLKRSMAIPIPVLPLIRYVCMSISLSSIHGSMLTLVPLDLRTGSSESIYPLYLFPWALLIVYLYSVCYELTQGSRPTLETNTEQT